MYTGHRRFVGNARNLATRIVRVLKRICIYNIQYIVKKYILYDCTNDIMDKDR